MSKPKNKKTDEAVEILHRRYVAGWPESAVELERIRADDDVARKIYDLRTKAGLSQRELAKLVHTSASAICRLEDADYEGHSLAMLHRIAHALNRRVEIRFMPLNKRRIGRPAGAKLSAGL
jgi:ribosome-binding protein aMBF1 (putative translation factor)